MQNPTAIRQSLRLFGVFLLCYAFTLPLWLGLKGHYQQLGAAWMFEAAGSVYDMKVQSHGLEGRELLFSVRNAKPSMDTMNKERGFIFDASLDVNAITFNVPMTLSLMLSMVFVFRRTKRVDSVDVLLNGMLALFVLHLLTFFIVSLSVLIGTAEQSDDIMYYLRDAWLPQEFIINFGTMLSSYAARFEPFVIALYVWYQLQKPEPKRSGTEGLEQ